jgi:16S rRNA (uracil1498-N3)-methyltransferase
MPKPERASWLVEKVTEIGVASVHFIASSRAPREPGSGTMARLRRVAAAAVEQCHRSRVPEVSGVHAWSELPSLMADATSRWMLDPRGENAAAAAGAASDGVAALVVGPEGGWSESESLALADLGCRPLRLGARILRTETAAVVGAGLLLAGRD